MADSMDLNPCPSKWTLVQLSAFCALSGIGYSGFTSLPFYVYKHSGLFAIGYFILLFLISTPLCYVQLKLGAIYKRGIVGIFSHILPLYKGVAVTLLIMTYFRSITHALEISYGVYYMFASCMQPFPWTLHEEVNVSSHELKITIFDNYKTTPEDSYFINDFLQRSPQMGIWGPLVWYLVLCALTVWILVYLIILRGSTGFAKVLIYVVPSTAVLILIVTIYGYTAVPTYLDSLKKFILTDHRKHKIPESHNTVGYILSFPEFWLDALDLHIYGLGLWAGILPYIGTHITNAKKIVRWSWGILTVSQIYSPIILLIMLMPFIDPQYPGGILSYEVGVKPGLSYLFVAIPHTFHKHGLSSFILFLIYAIYVMISIQHLSFHILMIWENVWPSLPKAVITFFKRTSILLAAVCFFSFLLTSPYLSQRGLLLYQIVRFYVDHLLFAVVIFSMVPFIIGFIRQETLRMPIDRIFMGVWYGSASLIAACFLVYNLIVFVYPESVERYEQKWIEHLGWCVSVSPCLLGVSLGALHTILSLTGSFKERLVNSVKVGTPSVDDTGDDCLSVDTGDTDLKTPCTSRHNTPMTQARAPLLKHQNSLMEQHCHGPQHKNSAHTLFPHSLAPLPLGQTADPCSAQSCINSPTAGREAFTQDTAATFGYGTLQFPKPKATVEVVMRSTSDGNISRL